MKKSLSSRNNRCALCHEKKDGGSGVDLPTFSGSVSPQNPARCRPKEHHDDETDVKPYPSLLHHFLFSERQCGGAASVRAVAVQELVRIIIFRQPRDDLSRNQGGDGGIWMATTRITDPRI